MNSRLSLSLQFAVLYLGLPLAILYLRDRGAAFMLLWGAAVLCFWVMHRQDELRHNAAGLRAGLRGVLLRFAVLAPMITAAAWVTMPESFLSFPLQRPEMWVRVMLLYPILSVWPQEMIYRAFLYHRFGTLFGAGFVVASALAFGFMHVILLNWVAVAMSAAGGLLIAGSYARHKSLTLSCLEHALYGQLVFTVGLGRFFYSGAAWS